MTHQWLMGWKSIAEYLRCSERTAQRYHENYEMPVYALPNGTKYGLKSELDQWLKEHKNGIEKNCLS